MEKGKKGVNIMENKLFFEDSPEGRKFRDKLLDTEAEVRKLLEENERLKRQIEIIEKLHTILNLHLTEGE